MYTSGRRTNNYWRRNNNPMIQGGFQNRNGTGRSYHSTGRRGRGGGGGGGRGGGNSFPRNPFIVGYKKLFQWSQMENHEELTTDLFGKKTDFGKTINNPNIREDWIRLSLNILVKVTKSSASVMKKQIFGEISNFWKLVLPRFLQKQRMYSRDTNGKNEIINMTLNLMRHYVIMFPAKAKDLPFSELIELTRNIGDKEQERQIHNYQLRVTSNVSMTTHNSQHPPNDFRQIPTFPTMDEIHGKTPSYLRPIKGKGCYDNASHYLDIQFRLLKEDLVSPLRDGVRELMGGVREKKQDIKMYSSVELLSINCTNSGLTYTISFDPQNNRGIFWKHTKKLIFGSLVCFSNDGFKTMVFASVANRDPKDLEKGQIDVRFLDGLQTYNYFRRNSKCEMIECPSYFEAYKHVLDGLKEIEDEELPMQDYIVDCQNQNKTPEYLRQSLPRYDLTSVMQPKYKQRFNPGIQLLNPNGWPAESNMIFNPSQYEAFKHALTKKFAVIQGPPGTGKTFVALKIVDALLKNKQYWQQTGEGPMLIVCYTNHALDQFLTGLIDHGHQNIIRVGGRAKPELEEYMLKTALQNRSKESTGYIRKAKYESHQERESVERRLEPHLENLHRHHKKLVNGKLLQLKHLEDCISPRHMKYLKRYEAACKNSQFSVFEIFLQIFDLQKEDLENIKQEPSAPYQNSSRKYLTQAPKVESEDLVDIEGEGEALVDRWAVDQNQFARKKQSMRKQNQSDDETDASQFKQLTNKDGFTFVLPKKQERKRRIHENLKKYSPMTMTEMNYVVDPWSLTLGERWRLYQHWLMLYTDGNFKKIEELAEEFEEACQSLKELKEQEDEQVLRRADVIAMTTTCAARYRRILKNIGPKIVVIEEAAEVLEAHVITALTPSTEHLILIGDHKQLRPNPSVYDLAKKFNLELSLFERMVNNGMDCQTLNVQHRMRPEISKLIKNVYPRLQDHPKVAQYPHIMGVSKDVVFISHSVQEQQGAQKSKANKHEAAYLVSLCRYFLLQGYQPSQITLLTGYSGQLSEMKKMMPRNEFEGVRVTTVDNFQGEENDIILLSLVRSNVQGNIGFLGTENRVNVALSRAKHGLYVIGNFDLLERKTPLWEKIVGDCRSMGYLATGIELCCQNHPSVKIVASRAEDFTNTPDGGCTKDCSFRMKCGHVCWKKCHPVDPQHEQINCNTKCQKKCDKGHSCPDICHFRTRCQPCKSTVRKILPRCGHTKHMQCHQDPTDMLCFESCERKKPCGHKCAGKCMDDCHQYPCKTKVMKKMTKCGHVKMMECQQDPSGVKCLKACEKVKPCGHKCVKKCGDFCLLYPCKENVTKKLPKCEHSKTMECCQEASRVSCATKIWLKFACGCLEEVKCQDWIDQTYERHRCLKKQIKDEAMDMKIQIKRKQLMHDHVGGVKDALQVAMENIDNIINICGQTKDDVDPTKLKAKLRTIQTKYKLTNSLSSAMSKLAL